MQIPFPAPSTKHNLCSSLKTALRIVLFVLLLWFIFFQSPLLPLHHITQLRLLRSFVFLWGCLFLQKSLSAGKLSLEPLPLLLLLLWLVPYSYVFSRIPDYFQEDVGSYWIFPSLLYTTVWLLQRLLPQAGRLRLPVGVLCALPLWGEITSALAYLFYFVHYGKPMDEIILMSIIATTPLEAYNYLTATFSQPLLLTIFLLLAGSFLALVHSLAFPAAQKGLSPRSRKKVLAILALVLYFTGSYTFSVFPMDHLTHLYKKGGPMRAFLDLKENLPQNAQKLKLSEDKELASQRVPGTIILVIGESATRDAMSAFAPISFDSTPWERAMKQNPNFFFYPNSYANFPNTVMAVTQALTSANQYNRVPLKKAVDLMTLAKKAGYTTYWLSTQEKSSVSDAGITLIAQQSENIKWIKGNDEAILPALKNIPKGQNNFIVLHLTGSHFRYDQRIPEAYCLAQGWELLDKEEKEIWYQRSLHHTDSILQQIYQQGQDRFQMQALVYFSDHGEDLELTHTASPFKFNMVRIPFWIYLSPSYQAAYPETVKVLRQHESAIFTNDLVFDTMSGLLQAPSNFYDARHDLTQPDYQLTQDNALTLHGKKKISEE